MLSRVKIDKAIVLLVTILIVLLGVIALRFFTEDNTNKYTKVKEPEVQISRENEVKVQEIISGNTIITGHNYRNGRLFSNNNSISTGDKIYITTVDNVRKEYTVYDKFLTTPEDASFYIRDTSNGPEITLSSCSDDDTQRVIILAK